MLLHDVGNAILKSRETAIKVLSSIGGQREVEVFYRVSQKKRGAFVEVWCRIEPLDHRELNFSMQPTF